MKTRFTIETEIEIEHDNMLTDHDLYPIANDAVRFKASINPDHSIILMKQTIYKQPTFSDRWDDMDT